MMQNMVMNMNRRVNQTKRQFRDKLYRFIAKHTFTAFVLGLVLIPALSIFILSAATALIMVPVSFLFGWI